MSDALADADFVDVVVEQAGMPGGQALIGTQTRIDRNLSPDTCRLTLGNGRNAPFLPVAMPAMSDRLGA